MGSEAFGKEIFVDAVLLFMNEAEMLMDWGVIVERDVFDGLEESFLFSFVEKFFSGGNLLFRFGVSRGNFLQFEVFESLERLDCKDLLFRHEETKRRGQVINDRNGWNGMYKVRKLR